jgi:O-antigen/teichoic acid export membrane protein
VSAVRSRNVRRLSTAVGLYSSVGLGLFATIVATWELDRHEFGLYATAIAAAALFESLLDLTVEESLTKYGFRYIAAADWGRLRRLFGVAVRLKALGAVLALVALVVAAFAVGGSLRAPLLAVAFLPLVQTQEDVAATALLLRSRYDIRAAFLVLSMALRLGGIAAGAHYGPVWAIVGVLIAQFFATAAIALVGVAAFRRFPTAPTRPLGEDRREIVAFVAQSSVATGVISLRTLLPPILLGAVAGTTEVGVFRIAQAPQSGLAAASSPVRLILLTEQTRDWEHGREQSVMSGVRRYTLGAAALMVVSVPVFYWAMPALVRIAFHDKFPDAVTPARVMLFAAALQVVVGWSKSLPVTIGKPKLRIWAHGIETVVLLPLVVVLGWKWGVTGAASAILVSSVVFVAVWAVFLVRLRGEVAARTTATAASP